MKNTITRAHIDALLAASEVDVCTKFDKVTVVTVKLPNGFVLVEASGAVDKANYNEETGRKVCLDRIAQKLWSFEGYQLSSAIATGLVGAAERLCASIEQLPASPQQTEVSVQAGELFSRLAARTL
jgi:hypothetical protein